MRSLIRLGCVMVLGAGCAWAQSAQTVSKPVKIVLVGDSTVATEGGWGPGFCALAAANVTCIDDALNGRTTKSFIDQGAWQRALDRKGSYYLIQFGHNDQKPGAHLPVPLFEDYLKRYVADVRAIGGTPVLVTSLSRRNYKGGVLIEDLTAYVNATKEVGAEEHVTVVDLNALSTAMLKPMTQAEADRFDRGNDPQTGLPAASPAGGDNVAATASGVDTVKKNKMDRTHLNPYGQKVFGRMMAVALVRERPELKGDFDLGSAR